MDLRERLTRALVTGRGLTEKLLADVTTPEQWLTSIVDGGNHPLWIAGHLAVADDAFVRMVCEDRSRRRDDYRKAFGKGSQPVPDLQAYDDPENVLAYLRDRRAALLETLAELPESAFEQPLPESAPAIMYDVASVFHMAAWHEALHTGQLTTIRRSFGLGPIV